MYNKSLLPYYQLFHHAPVATAILDVEGFKLEMVNEKMLQLWGRCADIVKLPLLDFLPELAEQEYPEILAKVAETGQVWQEQGARVRLNRGGQLNDVFMDYSYTPIFNEAHKTTAILVMATDISVRELSKLMLEQSDRNLRAMVLSAPVPMCVYKGAGFSVVVVNSLMLEVWRDCRDRHLAALRHVFHNGVSYSFTEDGLRYTCTPLGDGILGVSGICVIASKFF